ncbi:hydrogenase [bacterium]|nr:hydrogenase [bacterium]
MLNIIRARLQQKHRTIKYPDAAPPEMPEKFAGRPVVVGRCPDGCRACQEVCPTQAITGGPSGPVVDTGRCLFCSSCVSICGEKAIAFSRDHRLAAVSRESLVIRPGSPLPADVLCETARKYFKRSFRLRQVSAGGCNACEADCNVLGTPVWDMGRFGIQFVASPRHADGILVTGPVTGNMREALLKTWEAVPDPRVVIAVGSCAVSGGPYRDHAEVHNGAGSVVPVDLFVPGCPPHPLTILDGLLRFLGYPVTW